MSHFSPICATIRISRHPLRRAAVRTPGRTRWRRGRQSTAAPASPAPAQHCWPDCATRNPRAPVERWCDIEEFGRAKLDWLRRYVPLTNGIPVDDTIARIISALSVSGFQECFLSWMEDVVKLSDGEIIALDGKTHRRTHDRKRGVKALHMVSAWASRNGVVLGQVKTDEKSNEITAVPELLEKLELKGCIVTLDAMGCQRAIAKQVKEGGGDYVLALKRNQPELDREVQAHFEAAQGCDFSRSEIGHEATSEEGHGRIEHRSYFLSTDLSSLVWCREVEGFESDRDGGVGTSLWGACQFRAALLHAARLSVTSPPIVCHVPRRSPPPRPIS